MLKLTRKIKFLLVILLLALGCVSCSKDDEVITGPVDITLIRPTGKPCEYTIAPTTITGLTSVRKMKGSVGKVVYTSEDIFSREEILGRGETFQPVDALFAKSGNTYRPLDLDALFTASLYYSVYFGHQLFSRLNSQADLSKIVPGFSDTTIIHELHYEDEDGTRNTDNAAYLYYQTSRMPEGKNYIFSYPTSKIENVPLGLNLGVMVHEYTHMVFRHLFWQKGGREVVNMDNPPQLMWRTLKSLDEGLADYFGFIGVRDGGFFLCSYPDQTTRDLRKSKSFDSTVTVNGIQYTIADRMKNAKKFDSHLGGAVFASINYEIGETLGGGIQGHEQNGQWLIDMMASMSVTSSSTFTFANVRDNHAAAAGSQGGTVRNIYNKYLGEFK